MMLDAGLYQQFGIPDYGIGLHCSPTIPAGQVGFGKGYTMANTESIDIRVFGVGAHGASPHMSIDPIVIASMIIMDLHLAPVTRERAASQHRPRVSLNATSEGRSRIAPHCKSVPNAIVQERPQ